MSIRVVHQVAVCDRDVMCSLAYSTVVCDTCDSLCDSLHVSLWAMLGHISHSRVWLCFHRCLLLTASICQHLWLSLTVCDSLYIATLLHMQVFCYGNSSYQTEKKRKKGRFIMNDLWIFMFELWLNHVCQHESCICLHFINSVQRRKNKKQCKAKLNKIKRAIIYRHYSVTTLPPTLQQFMNICRFYVLIIILLCTKDVLTMAPWALKLVFTFSHTFSCFHRI